MTKEIRLARLLLGMFKLMQTKNEFKSFDYKITRSLRTRSIRISVFPNCEIKVTAHSLLPEFVIHDFVNKKSDWIIKNSEIQS